MNLKDLDWGKALKYALIGGGGLLVVSQLGKIIRGIILGLVFIGIAFFLTWSSVKSIKEDSKSVEELELQKASDVNAEVRELVKIYGEIEVDESLAVSVETCDDPYCFGVSEDPVEFEDLLYFRIKFEQLQVKEKKTTTSNSDGTSTSTTEYTEEWVELDDFANEMWATFTMDEIEIDPEDAKIRIEKEDADINNVYLDNAPTVQTYGQDVSDAIGSVRASIEYIPVDDREYIVIGEMRSTGISSGDTFVFTDQSEEEIVSTLSREESTQRWGMRALAFFLLTIGLTSMLSPVLVFTDLIPIVGGAARSIATVVSGIVAFVVIALTIFLINFWWIFFIIMLIGIAFAIRKLILGKDLEKHVKDLEKEEKPKAKK